MSRPQVTIALLVILMGLVTTLPMVSAQLKPDIDANIPAYQPVAPISGHLLIVGSETMKPLSEAWIADMRAYYPLLTGSVQSGGSEEGLALLFEGKAPVAAMSRKMRSQEIVDFKREFGYEPTEVPVGIDALAVYVHKDNKLPGLTLAELDALFSDERRRGLSYNLHRWTEFLLEGDYQEASIKLYSPNRLSGTTTFFREHVCNDAPFKKRVEIKAGPASVVMAVAQDRYGIGFGGIGYRTSDVRPVPIASVAGGRYIEPTFQSAMEGSYPLRRPLYLYINRAPKSTLSPAVAEFVKLALSYQGQQVVLAKGYYPLPTSDISRLRATWAPPIRAAAEDGPPKLRD
ncbi:Phosphate ABC transporter, periplasmic phosphate-binding protein, PstS [Nitrospira sp. KM1]|uniref:PstS family phosphate ABC transporter substrate-binding protein n=1 Tax=Nitrospira sp. KM1 TaxID=1936990 RepID=UPI0013A762D7|nr:substrate-binding domain-containing protein [Nitrospira sp. KM1]BCA54905.1 Phosphate ABC transporter, periplasmic phosphate-binding protein, PstS [Nitrospira sp. KM1]